MPSSSISLVISPFLVRDARTGVNKMWGGSSWISGGWEKRDNEGLTRNLKLDERPVPHRCREGLAWKRTILSERRVAETSWEGREGERGRKVRGRIEVAIRE